MSDSVRPHRRQPTGLPGPWDSPGKNTGVGCHFLLQEIFPTRGPNPGLQHCRQTLYRLSHQRSHLDLKDPTKASRPDPCCPPPQPHLSLFYLLGACGHLPLPLAFCTHHGASHVYAFTHVGCAAWNTFSISLHLNTIF